MYCINKLLCTCIKLLINYCVHVHITATSYMYTLFANSSNSCHSYYSKIPQAMYLTGVQHLNNNHIKRVTQTERYNFTYEKAKLEPPYSSKPPSTLNMASSKRAKSLMIL